MLTFTVKRDFTGITNNLRQIPFSTALALTRTAKDCQAEVRAELPSRFTIRNGGVSRGIRIKAATKSNLESSIFSLDDFMVLQETGGVKTPSGSNLAIPEDVRTSKAGLVLAGNRPAALRGNPGVFRARIGGLDGLWQRMTKRSRKKTGRALKLLFVFKPSVQVPARFGFIETVKRIAKARFASRFREAFDQAVRTAK